MIPVPDLCRAGQESVWDFPRPAIAERSQAHILIVHDDRIVADTRASIRTLETSHPPSYYIPQTDIASDMLARADGGSLCEWKGKALYWDVTTGGSLLRRAAWSYPDPDPRFAMLRGHIAFYAGPFDRCTVNGEQVTPQPGPFYGGWITSDLAGPFKGVAGSRFW